MKKSFEILAMCMAVALSCFTLQSCDNDDNDYSIVLPNALVTVKQMTDGEGFYMQLDEETTLLPVNMKKSPFGDKEVRALVNYTYTDDPSAPYTKAVHVNWIDSILTKPTVPDMGEDNAKVYGNDEVEIVRNWVTIAEDGYLTLRFRTYWGGLQPHIVNLVAGANPENPYELVFCHNANGDAKRYAGDGIVAFSLDKLPDTEGKTVDLTLKWRSFSGEKSTTFKYCSRKSSDTDGTALAEGTFIKDVK